MHSFSAYIDEAGDEGFTFREDSKGSSEWFIVSACVIRNSNMANAARQLNETLVPIESKRKSPVHFAKLPHDARIAIVHQVSKLPIKAISVCFNKKNLGSHGLDSNRRLYFYCTRFVLERISWIARDHSIREIGAGRDGKCKLTFSHCKGLSYESLKTYLEQLQNMKTRIAWDHLDITKISVLGHNDSPWLRVADTLASGIYQGLEINQYGHSEDKYARIMQPVVYRNGTNFTSYGMKLFPPIAQLEKEKDNRYDWLSIYK